MELDDFIESAVSGKLNPDCGMDMYSKLPVLLEEMFPSCNLIPRSSRTERDEGSKRSMLDAEASSTKKQKVAYSSLYGKASGKNADAHPDSRSCASCGSQNRNYKNRPDLDISECKRHTYNRKCKNVKSVVGTTLITSNNSSNNSISTTKSGRKSNTRNDTAIARSNKNVCEATNLKETSHVLHTQRRGRKSKYICKESSEKERKPNESAQKNPECACEKAANLSPRSEHTSKNHIKAKQTAEKVRKTNESADKSAKYINKNEANVPRRSERMRKSHAKAKQTAEKVRKSNESAHENAKYINKNVANLPPWSERTRRNHIKTKQTAEERVGKINRASLESAEKSTDIERALQYENPKITARKGTLKYLKQVNDVYSHYNKAFPSSDDLFAETCFGESYMKLDALLCLDEDETFSVRTPVSKDTSVSSNVITPRTMLLGKMASSTPVSSQYTSSPDVPHERSGALKVMLHHNMKRTRGQNRRNISKEFNDLPKSNLQAVKQPSPQFPVLDDQLVQDEMSDLYFNYSCTSFKEAPAW